MSRYLEMTGAAEKKDQHRGRKEAKGCSKDSVQSIHRRCPKDAIEWNGMVSAHSTVVPKERH